MGFEDVIESGTADESSVAVVVVADSVTAMVEDFYERQDNDVVV